MGEKPLSLQMDTQVKFHILLEDGGGRWLTTLGREPLQFIPRGQDIVEPDGTTFIHPLKYNIWKMVVKCTKLGDGDKTIVKVWINNTTGKYEWRNNLATVKDANL
jgi:hypothetical protein